MFLRTPFELNAEFQNVPEHIACSKDCKFWFNARMLMREHITLLEGRATLQTIRHLARSQNNFGLRHLHLGDNLGMVLAFDRGRVKVFPLLICCRRAAAYGVAMGARLFHRRIPSEWNAADGPSRKWEEKSKNAEVSKRFVKKTIDKIIYPRRYQVRNDSCLEGRCSTRGAAFIQSEDGSDPRQDQGEDLRRASTESMRLDPGEPSSTKVPWPNSAGGVCSVTPNLQQLPAKNQGISRVLQHSSPHDVHCWSGRQRKHHP